MFPGRVKRCFAFAEGTLCCSHFPCLLPLGLLTLSQQPFLSLTCNSLCCFANSQANKLMSFLPLESRIGFFFKLDNSLTPIYLKDVQSSRKRCVL